MLFGNKKVFSARANCSGLSDTFRMSGGSLFHWFGPDTEKPRRPNLSVLARGTTRSPWSVVRSRSRCILHDCRRFWLLLLAGVPSCYVTNHSGQLSLLFSTGWDMIIGETAVMLCGCEVKAGVWLISLVRHVLCNSG